MPKIRVTAKLELARIIYTDQRGENALAEAWQRGQAALDRGDLGDWEVVEKTVTAVRVEESG